MAVLSDSFYQSTNVLQISKDLLGKYLITHINGSVTSGVIVETEAYEAPQDKASHAYGNKLTPRTETMFYKGGCSYVYICYGIHHLFNVITGPEGLPHAVLIRAIEPKENIPLMLKRRGLKKLDYRLTSGPGKAASALGISKKHNALDLRNNKGKVWIEDRGIRIISDDIISGPRVGMTSAQECAHWPYRFRIKRNPWSSKPDVVKYNF